MSSPQHTWRPRKYRNLLKKFVNAQFYTAPGAKPGSIVHATHMELDQGEVNCLIDLLHNRIEENTWRALTEKVAKENDHRGFTQAIQLKGQTLESRHEPRSIRVARIRAKVRPPKKRSDPMDSL